VFKQGRRKTNSATATSPAPPGAVRRPRRAFPRCCAFPRQHTRRGVPESALPACPCPGTRAAVVLALARLPAVVLACPRYPCTSPARASHLKGATAPPWHADTPSPRCRAAGTSSAVPPRPERRRRRVQCSACVHHCLSAPEWPLAPTEDPRPPLAPTAPAPRRNSSRGGRFLWPPARRSPEPPPPRPSAQTKPLASLDHPRTLPRPRPAASSPELAHPRRPPRPGATLQTQRSFQGPLCKR
jgi:hypothetical protein